MLDDTATHAACPEPAAPARSATRGILRATKAETLAALREGAALPDGTFVPALVHFTVGEWLDRRRAVLDHVLRRLRGDRLAVRSSALDEDQGCGSRAGHYRSHLDVPRDPRRLAAAIDDVVASYDTTGDHRVLVQDMVDDLVACGVLVTRDPSAGGPYRIFEFEEGARADAVTRGVGAPRRTVVHRAIDVATLPDGRSRRVLDLALRLERHARRHALEIELAERRDGTIALLQVRALATPGRAADLDARVARVLATARDALEVHAAPRPGIVGSGTILGQMPDWNPAELIGTFPAPLAASLFQDLITDDVWQLARATMGYRAVPDTRLMTIVAGRPWIDVRASCNSFLPAGLDDTSGGALVDGWLARLRARPELHDALELGVVESLHDFDFAARLAAAPLALTQRGRARWAALLRALTARSVDVGPGSSLARALATVEHLGRAPLPPLPAVRREPSRTTGHASERGVALALLDACRAGGTLPFAVIARHAFLSEALLRSAVSRGALSPDRLETLRAARRTVSTELAHDLAATRRGRLAREELLRRYGHLRPGSFDVTAPRWDARPSLLDGPPSADAAHGEPTSFCLTARESSALTLLAREIGLRVDGRGLVAHANAAVVGRERAKLLLTRHLSSALEQLAAWAARHGWSRHELACLTLADIRAAGDELGPCTRRLLDERIAARRADEDVLRAIRLGPLLCDVRDLYVQHDASHAPTFVTTRIAAGRPLFLDGRRDTDEPPGGRVICIESADPGFDWIFTHRIAGLVTRFGGGNSHMAIRCSEHRVPAAIGVGETLFDRLRGAASVELRCHDRQVRCLGPVASA